MKTGTAISSFFKKMSCNFTFLNLKTETKQTRVAAVWGLETPRILQATIWDSLLTPERLYIKLRMDMFSMTDLLCSSTVNVRPNWV